MWCAALPLSCPSAAAKLPSAALKLPAICLQEMVLGLATLGPVTSSQAQHNSLLAAYLSLCEDKVWAVRKACADVLPDMSKLAPADMRKTQLLPVFDKLCDDVSHWVQNAALQQLGTFISTLEAPVPPSESDHAASTTRHTCPACAELPQFRAAFSSMLHACRSVTQRITANVDRNMSL